MKLCLCLVSLSFALANQNPQPVTLSHVPSELTALTTHSGAVQETAADWPCLSQGFNWNFGSTEITWRHQERPTPSAAWSSSKNTYTTSFEISAACYRDAGDDVFVAGLKATGELVIERWSFPSRAGKWHHVPPAIQAIGTPMGPYVGTTEINGGTWSAPAATHPSPARRVILETSGIQLVRGMDADPEGRFILFQDHGTHSLYRIRLDQGSPGAPELLYTVAQIPELARTVWVNVAEVTATGKRFWLLSEPDDDSKQLAHCARVMLWDNENDGVFDSTQALEYAAFRSTYLAPGVCRVPWAEP